MARKLTVFCSCLFAMLLAHRLNAGIIDGSLTVNMSKEVAEALDKIGPNLGQAIKEGGPVVGEELRKTVPVVGAEIRRTMQESVPHLDANITKASDAIVKAARSISNIRAWPIVGIGLAGVVTSIVMLARGVERYIDADDEKQKSKAKWRITASLIGLGLSGCVMGNSQPILEFFSE